MMFNFSSISKSLDKERLPKKKIELLIEFLEHKKMSPHFFLNDKTFLVTPKSKLNEYTFSSSKISSV